MRSASVRVFEDLVDGGPDATTVAHRRTGLPPWGPTRGARPRRAPVLEREAPIRRLAQQVAEARDVLYLGRGLCHPIALEGALKLKEISYIHAEGYHAGEMKHGPIALIDPSVPVIAIAPSGPLFEKTASNLQEAAARGGKVIVFSDEEDSGSSTG